MYLDSEASLQEIHLNFQDLVEPLFLGKENSYLLSRRLSP